MARTPIAAKNTQDPTYSEGYVCNQSPDTIDSIFGGEDGFRSLIDLTSRTPSHIRFGDIEPEGNQLALIPLVTCPLAEKETRLIEALAVIRYLEELMRNANKPKDVILDVPQQTGIIARQDGDRSTTGIDSAPEESTRTGLPMVDSHHIVPAPLPETANRVGLANHVVGLRILARNGVHFQIAAACLVDQVQAAPDR